MTAGIRIDIDALVLRDQHSFDADSFSGALTSELTRLLQAGAPSVGSWQLEAVHMQLPNQYDSATLGIHIAQAVYAQLRGGGL